MERLALTVEEAAKAAGVGRTLIFQAIRSRRLIARKFGRRTLILAEDLAQFLANLPRTCRRSPGGEGAEPRPKPEVEDIKTPDLADAADDKFIARRTKPVG
jgi:excisionase family DNA binding protein